MDKSVITDSVIVSYDLRTKDDGVTTSSILIVGRVLNGKNEIVKYFSGEAADSLWRALTEGLNL